MVSPSITGGFCLSPVTGSLLGPHPTFHIYGAISTGPTVHPHVNIALMNCPLYRVLVLGGASVLSCFPPLGKEAVLATISIASFMKSPIGIVYFLKLKLYLLKGYGMIS